MSSKSAKIHKERLKKALLHHFNDECLFCDSKDNLEFAHKNPDEMNGRGRGSNKRYIYIQHNIWKFFLLCKSCHHAYDMSRKTIDV